jgi:hypothetical protein
MFYLKMGQIIDFRAMINEATKLNADDTGAGNGSVSELRTIFSCKSVGF